MIIDCILDRKDEEETMKQGFTHTKMWDGTIRELGYNAKQFYLNVYDYMDEYDDPAYRITYAMDFLEEEDVKAELCKYVIENEYNPAICDYINSRTWLQ